MFKSVAVLAVSCGALLAGCGTDDAMGENEEIVSNLIEAGYPADTLQVVDGAVYAQGDGHVTLQASREMLERGEGSQEHYRTTNLVNKTTVRKICLNPTSTFNGYAKLSQGLDLAIANYNALGLCFTMVRGPSTGCNANIAVRTTTGTSAFAGFPSGGLPYSNINIGTGLTAYTVDVVEHLITHELGHAIGLRHSDYYMAGTCSTNEGTAGVGAIHIPGTPTTSYVGMSLMNSCWRTTETGELTSSDITALRYLYYGGC